MYYLDEHRRHWRTKRSRLILDKFTNTSLQFYKQPFTQIEHWKKTWAPNLNSLGVAMKEKRWFEWFWSSKVKLVEAQKSHYGGDDGFSNNPFTLCMNVLDWIIPNLLCLSVCHLLRLWKENLIKVSLLKYLQNYI